MFQIREAADLQFTLALVERMCWLFSHASRSVEVAVRLRITKVIAAKVPQSPNVPQCPIPVGKCNPPWLCLPGFGHTILEP